MQTWIQHYNGPAQKDDYAVSIAADKAGGVYVTGSSNSAPGEYDSSSDYATIRYDAATGEQTWVQRYDNPTGSNDVASAIAIGADGSIFVTGTSDQSNTTIRYNATGQEIWIGKYSAPAGSSMITTALAVDENGVYITGTRPIDDGTDYATLRYDLNTGELSWAVYYDGPAKGNDQAIAIALDKAGGVYITGTSGNSNSYDAGQDLTTIRYDAASGKEKWVQRYGGSEDARSQGIAIAADEAGAVFVTGSNEGESVTIRYEASTGNKIWEQRYKSATATALAFDEANGLYVTGTNTDVANSDIVTIRYVAATGVQSWVSRYDGTGHTFDFPVSVAVDTEGNTYVTGSSSFPGSGPITIATVKYSPSGEQLWATRYSGYASARAIAIDNKGGVYVTGESYGNDPSGFIAEDFITIRYDAVTGQQTWANLYDGPAGDMDGAVDVAVDDADGIYVTGYSYSGELSQYSADYATIKYHATTGELIWSQHFSGPDFNYDFPRAIAIDKSGGVFITGVTSNNLGNQDIATIRYDAASGKQTWVNLYGDSNSYDDVSNLALDTEGSVYIVGSTRDDYAIVRFETTTGKILWDKHYDVSSGHADKATAIAVDEENGIYVTGWTEGKGSNFVTIRLKPSSGELEWNNYSNPSDERFNIPTAMSVDNIGGLYITGFSYSNSNPDEPNHSMITARYHTATGEQIWIERYAASSARGVDLALDGFGNVIVSGYSQHPDTGFDFLTVKYSQDGACPALAAAPVSGYSTVSAGLSKAAYSLAAPGATSLAWSITDPEGNLYSDFSGQGTSSIRVDWPREPEVYKISVSYSSGESCPATTATRYVFVHDPAAGFVTGGGWSDSPLRPELELMRQGGSAWWAFAARYASTPRSSAGSPVQGTLLLALESGHTFRAASVEEGSLVIAGDRAYFTGTGKLTRRGAAGGPETDPRRLAYLVSAVDGQLEKPREEDRLRLVIWVLREDGSRGETLYDNQLACPGQDLNAPACQQIDRGSIVIHRQGIRSVSDLFATATVEPKAQGLTAYPTAFSQSTTLSFTPERDADYSLELYDLKGALVRKVAEGSARTGRRTEHELVAEGLPQGLYLIRLSTGSEVQTAKVIVEK
ncbi:SBBP repeat-containing protein [Pontibacter ramchanderi]